MLTRDTTYLDAPETACVRCKELLNAMDWYGTWTLHFGDDCR